MADPSKPHESTAFAESYSFESAYTARVNELESFLHSVEESEEHDSKQTASGNVNIIYPDARRIILPLVTLKWSTEMLVQQPDLIVSMYVLLRLHLQCIHSDWVYTKTPDSATVASHSHSTGTG